LSGALIISLRTVAAASSRFSVSLATMELPRSSLNSGADMTATANEKNAAIGINLLLSTVDPPLDK
jgi:hypothetical protein